MHYSAENISSPASPEDLFSLLKQLNIDFERHHHDAVFTVQESEEIERDIPGTHCRNLYLRDKKKRNFLVTAMNETPIDLKALPTALECGRLSFGSAERLWEFLGVKPGSVCPFAVINDPEHHVQVVLDEKMMQQERVNYHPLQNTMTIGVSPGDLLKFLSHTGHPPKILDLEELRSTS